MSIAAAPQYHRPVAIALAAIALVSAACVANGDAPPAEVPAASAEAAPASPQPAKPTSSEPKEVVALDESDVPRAEIAAETRIRAIRSLAGRTLETDDIAASAKRVLDSVDTLKGWMRSREPRQQTPRALRSLGQEWSVDQQTLGTWMETTSRRLDALSEAQAELKNLEKLWATTDKSLQALAAPAEIQERARSVLGSIREVRVQVSTVSDKVLLLESDLSTAKLDAEEALEAIDAALLERHKKLLAIESPPIWKLIGPGAGREPISTELRAAVAETGRALRQYAARARRDLLVQLGLFVLLVVAFYRLRRGSRAWPADDRGLRACARLVQWPILGAGLVALLCGLWIHPLAPLAFYELSSILLVVPVVVLLRGIVRPSLKPALNVVALIFVAERLWETTWAGSFLERAVLLGLTILSMASLVWVFRPSAPDPEVVARRWWRVATVAGRVALAALAVSLVANVIGMVSLARLLTTTVVRAGYAGVVLYAAALLLRGAIGLFVRLAAAWSFKAVERHGALVVHRVSLAIDATMVFFFLFFVLTAAGLIPLVRDIISETLTKSWAIGGYQFSIASALVFVAAIYASIVVSRLIRAVLEDDVYPRVTLPRGVPSTVTMMVRYGVITLGFLLALSIAGIPLDRLALILSALSVGIGFGLQTVVNNFVSGLILMFERPIQIGDAVEVSGLIGRVKTIGVRASTIETFDGAEVIVPNGDLVSNQLVNWTLSSRSRRIEFQLSVAPGTDPEKLLAVLRDATNGHPHILQDPKATATIRGLSDTSIDCALQFWTSDFEGWTAVKSDAIVMINRALAEAGIALASPPDVAG